MSTEVNNESGAAVDEVALAELGRFVLGALGVNPLAELSVVLLDPEAMAVLHLQWMDLPGPTDVLAFPMDGGELLSERFEPTAPHTGREAAGEALLGDVVLCPVVAAEQAASAGHSTEAELHMLCIHGILHLLGYDHGDAEQQAEMFVLQAELAGAWTAYSGRGPINPPQPGAGAQDQGTR
jgi:probable rRNA maturation factor